MPEYWIVDPEARTIERWLPNDAAPATVADSIEWQPDAAVPPLVIELAANFDRVQGLVV